MKKSTITLIIVILMLVAICIFAFAGNKKEETKEVVKSNKITNSSIQDEKINEIVNEEVENEIEENEILENEVENTISTETLTEEPKTAEEKAIDIVKKDWNGKEAQFSVQGMDNNGNYIVAVTDSVTTESLAFYSVNINDGTFRKREIN